jgi:hypothetical protein
MKLNKKIIVNSGIAASLALASLTGCATDKSTPKDFFPADNEQRRSRQFMSAQANKGAREDATLGAYHFDGSKLNSLGSEKLARIAPMNGEGNVEIYLNLPNNDMKPARREEVMIYLKTLGMADASIKLHDGANLGVTTPTADGLARMSKVETGGAAGEESGSTEGTSAADMSLPK